MGEGSRTRWGDQALDLLKERQDDDHEAIIRLHQRLDLEPPPPANGNGRWRLWLAIGGTIVLPTLGLLTSIILSK